MKKIIPKLLLAFLFLAVTPTVFGASDCNQHEEGTHNWVPYWGGLQFLERYDDYIITYQNFAWNQRNFNNMKNRYIDGNVDYMYEIRRPGDANNSPQKDYWDYWKRTRPDYCEGVYFTNLPNPIEDNWSEEADWWMTECDNLFPFTHDPDDEEFEIKSLDEHNELEPYKEYYVTTKFWRDPEDRGKRMEIRSESEYCGIFSFPFCTDTIGFHWCTMTIDQIRA
ncbi:MAG: hypothetical protein Q7K34_01605 [archaeon]|nr:hypothetical protein [archaeon]